jgi:hypothetical protein
MDEREEAVDIESEPEWLGGFQRLEPQNQSHAS